MFGSKRDQASKSSRTKGRTGVLVGPRRIHLFRGSLKKAVAGEVQATEVAYEDGQLAKVLGLLLERGEIGGKVSIGLDPALDFLSTARADNPAQLEAQSQLSERLGSRLPAESQVVKTLCAVPRSS